MDDRFHPEEEKSGENKQNSYYSDNLKSKNEFKVSIDGLDNEPPEYVPQRTYIPTDYSKATPTQKEKPKFEIKIPTTPAPQRPITPKTAPAARPSGEKKASVSKDKHKSADTAKKIIKKPVQAKENVKKSNEEPKKKLTPQQIAKRNEAKKYRLIKGLLITCMCMIFIAAVTASLSTLALSTVEDILVLNKESSYTVSVVIPKDSKYSDVFKILCDNGLVKQKTICNLFCKFRQYNTVDYEPGVYYLESDSGIENMLETIMVHKSVSKDTARLTFPEGWTVAQIFAKIEKYGVCEADKLYANLDIIGEQYDFYSGMEATPGRYLKAEGYLFPDTYDFYIGESASSVLKKLFSNFQTKWTSEFSDSLKKSGFTKDQIIIIASIIQREAKDQSQMADISSVIHNRLADSATFPQLQMNSTQDYIKSLKDYDVLSDFYYSTYLQSYNTFSVKGLPPGAICNPSSAAIEAALNPSDTNYKFFCHDANGDIYLAETADEHAINIQEHLS